MDLKLKGKKAIVSGTGSQIGFGRGIALMLAQEGCDVACVDIDLEGAKKTAADVKAAGHKTLALKVDITKRADVDAAVKKVTKAMRTVPELLRIARVMETVAPKAILINFTNPVSIVTQALLNHSPVRAIGLCNIPIGLRIDLSRILGVAREKVKLDSVGLNHLSFVRRVLIDGADVLPKLVEMAGRREGRPANIPELDFPEEFLQALRMIPSDYLRYFFLQRESLEDQAKRTRTRAEEVMEIERGLLDHYRDPANRDKPAALALRGGAYYSHAALEVIDAISHDTGAELVVDVLNGGAVPELPSDAVVEVPCTVGAHGAKPLPQKALEPEIRGLIQHVKAYEELAVRAAVHRDRRAALLALVAHPLVPSATVATEIVASIAGELGLE